MLHNFFGNILISKGLWPPRSPDLNPCEYFFMKIYERSGFYGSSSFDTWTEGENSRSYRMNWYTLLCVLYFGLPKRYPLFYKSRASRQLAWQYPAAWVQRNSPLLNPAIPSSFFLIRPFPTNFNSSCPLPPAVANKKKVDWPYNRLHPAHFLQLFFSVLPSPLHPVRVPLGPFFGFFYGLVPVMDNGTILLRHLLLFFN